MVYILDKYLSLFRLNINKFSSQFLHSPNKESFMRFNIIIFISLLLLSSCGEKKKKVYTQFDTAEIVNQGDDKLSDSAKNGGIGFEK